ncbi:MAG: tetratricopeptide repeat protein, partial [Candidatus Limnocylindrales bacterium]
MINDLFERYKLALRRGHVAASRGQLDEAVVAYREAIDLAPDRVLPYTGLSGVLVRLDRSAEALTVLERAAVRAPSDESVWRARADLLIAANRRADAADCLDRLAAILDGQGRLAEACDVTREALDLAESRERRRGLEAYVKRLGTESGDAAAASVVGRAEASLREPGPAGSDMAHLPGSADLLAATERAMAAGDAKAVRTTALAASASQRRDG